MKKITVSASKKYNVIMEEGILSEAGKRIVQELGLAADPVNGKIRHQKICIVTDKTVDKLYAGEGQDTYRSLVEAGFEVYKYVFPGGEDHKSISTIEGILEYLAKEKFTRSDLLLALGGGITGDVTGFAASAYLRGIDYIQVPTTLLAVVDSSVGGKTGVNLSAGKNLVGAFWQPRLVLFDPDVLQTLSEELKLDGIAEAVKAGVIADPVIIDSVNQTCLPDDLKALTELAARAVEVKRTVVEEDERDNGCRQLLNFGHTFAHGIELCSNYRISHGHAVAMGMVIVTEAAEKLGWTKEPCGEAVYGILNRFGFPLACPFSAQELTGAALQDKKIRGNEITLVIPSYIGKCELKKIPVSELQAFIQTGLTQMSERYGI